MLNNIAIKIRPYLSRPLTNECEALYVIAEVRKMHDYHDENGRPRLNAMKMFCNWALHTEASKDAANIKAYFSAYDVTSEMSIEEYLGSQFFRGILNLNLLRQELKDFLNIHALPTLLADTQEQWANFVDLYTGIVSEIPMRCTKNDLLPENIEELTLYKIQPAPDLHPFARWVIKLKNGTCYQEDIIYRTTARN